MAKLKKLWSLAALALVGSAQAAPVLVTSEIALGANDAVNWSQLGSDGTVFGPNFSANSTNAVTVSGSLAGNNGCVTVVDGSTCGWTAGPGFATGDTVLWAEDDQGNGSGPLSLSFSSVLGAGLWLQANAASSFTAQIDVLFGQGGSASFTEASDANGNGLFIGVLDSVADITSITVTLQGCTGASCDFAVNSLLLTEATTNGVPEPASLALVVLPLMALPLARRRQARHLAANTEEST